VCVHGFMSTSLFIFVAEEINGQIRKGGEPSRHILQKVMLFCFIFMFLVACKVGVISLPGTCAPVASLEYEKKNQSDCVARVSGPLHKIPSNNPHKTSPTLCVLAAKKQHFYKKL
jgi:hypothetical protein